MSFSIDIKKFSGPMDLLLSLVEKEKIDIYDIEISKITDEFLSAIQELKYNSEEISDFIYMASVLVSIKSKTLISDSSDDDDQEISQEELLERLIEYKKYKRVSELFSELRDNASLYHSKLPEDLSDYSSNELIINSDIFILEKLFLKCLDKYKNKEEFTFEVEKILNRDEYSLSDYKKIVYNEVILNKEINIEELLLGKKNKSEIVVIFLSILDMVSTKELLIIERQNILYLTKGDDIERY